MVEEVYVVRIYKQTTGFTPGSTIRDLCHVIPSYESGNMSPTSGQMRTDVRKRALGGLPGAPHYCGSGDIAPDDHRWTLNHIVWVCCQLFSFLSALFILLVYPLVSTHRMAIIPSSRAIEQGNQSFHCSIYRIAPWPTSK
jgi:hypothetical protein